MTKPLPLRDRLFEKVNKNGPNGCWLWTGATDTKGYGQIFIRREGTRSIHKFVHRVSYELIHGALTPDQHLLHKCDTPLCVNPDHFFIGNQAANMRDKVIKGRQLKGEEIPNSKLTESDILEIRTMYATGRYTQKQLAKLYKVGPDHISRIVSRQVWAHVA